jgi:hypothetical protein
LRFNRSGAVKALAATLAYLAFATGASAAEGLAPSQAPKCLQLQYHGDSRAEIALHADRGVGAAHAISLALPSAVSRKRPVQILVSIGSSIMYENCQSIVSWIGSQNQRSAAAYSPSNARSDVTQGLRSKADEGQYQTRGSWYQRYATLVSNDNPRHPVAIEAVATKSAQTRHETPESLRDTRLMTKIGLLLGIGYLLFLMVWFWATRIRPRPARAGRGIDTGRRME